MAQPRRRRPPTVRAIAAVPASGLLTTLEAAALLRVHPKQVYRLFARGLPRSRVGDEWRYDRDELLSWAGGPSRVGRTDRSPPPVVASNGDVAVHELLAIASRGSSIVFGAAIGDRETALAMLRSRSILAAGYHGTTFPVEVPEGRMARLHLVRREVGLVAARGRQPRIADAARLRLASRPPTAGVRPVLDDALRSVGLDPERVSKRALICASHLEVVCAVSRGDAALGITTHAWARVLGLPFLRLADEEYGLLLFAEDLGRPPAVRLCEIAQGSAFRDRLDSHAGYDATECGRIRLDTPHPESAKAGQQGLRIGRQK